MSARRFAVVVGLALLGAGLWAWQGRYVVTHGNSDRYYVVIKLDRWTGRTWKLDREPDVPVREARWVWIEVR